MNIITSPSFNKVCYIDEKNNMIDITDNLDVQIYIIAHEFMHLQFIYHYKKSYVFISLSSSMKLKRSL